MLLGLRFFLLKRDGCAHLFICGLGEENHVPVFMDSQLKPYQGQESKHLSVSFSLVQVPSTNSKRFAGVKQKGGRLCGGDLAL